MNTRRLFHVGWWPIALCCLASVNSSHSQTFKAEGQLILSNPSNAQVKSSGRKFTAFIHNEQWLIRTYEANAASPVAYQEMAFDGTNRTSVMLLRPEKVSARSINVGSAARDFQRMPDMDPSFAAPIWLGLGSATHLKSLTNNLISPMWSNPPRRLVPRYEPTGEWEFNKQAQGFLESARFYETAGWMSAPYDGGFLRARFQVTIWTNVSGLTFPLGWDLQFFHPRTKIVAGKSVPEAKNRDDTWPGALFQVRVGRIELGVQLPRYRATPTGPVIMVDKRTTPYREYLTTPETFPEEDRSRGRRF